MINVTDNQTSYTLTGLTNGDYYHFVIRANNKNGSSPVSSVSQEMFSRQAVLVLLQRGPRRLTLIVPVSLQNFRSVRANNIPFVDKVSPQVILFPVVKQQTVVSLGCGFSFSSNGSFYIRTLWSQSGIWGQEMSEITLTSGSRSIPMVDSFSTTEMPTTLFYGPANSLVSTGSWYGFYVDFNGGSTGSSFREYQQQTITSVSNSSWLTLSNGTD